MTNLNLDTAGFEFSVDEDSSAAAWTYCSPVTSNVFPECEEKDSWYTYYPGAFNTNIVCSYPASESPKPKPPSHSPVHKGKSPSPHKKKKKPSEHHKKKKKHHRKDESEE